MTTESKKPTYDQLIEWEMPYEDCPEGGKFISREVTDDSGRWDVHKELTFQTEEQFGTDKAWCLSYRMSATEMQECEPFYDPPDICEVTRVTKTVEVWE